MKIGEVAVKAARPVHAGERFRVKREGVWMEFRALDPIEKRVGPKLVANHLEDLTSEESRVELAERRERARLYPGRGRPSRKEREQLNKLYRDDL